jgi:hypothetical protein
VTGGTTAYGLAQNVQIQSDVTASAYLFNSIFSTPASAFTLTTVNHFAASQGTIGAGSTVTNQIGYRVDTTLTGATNNYGFYGAIASGTGRYNFYAAGTADNYFAGNVGIGTSSPAQKLHVQSATPVVQIQDTTSAAGGVGGTINFVGFTSGTSGANVEAQIKGVKS